MAIKAVIFDMDGVLVDSEPAHQTHVREFFEEHGLQVPEKELHTLVGCSHEYFVERMDEWWERVPNKTDEERAAGAVVSFRQATKDKTIDYGPLLNPGVQETLEELRNRGIHLAVASSTSHAGIREELEPSDVLKYFEVVVSGEEFAHSKPDPEIYLTTMARLGLSANECIAVEDSDRGIAAGLAAGLRVAIKREPRFEFAQEGGTWYIDRIDELLEIVK
ncbi:MAG: HAD family phosphatase [Atopobiaceae bacterium]|nr:HAD family phosphatase [Atopobiaceae bacterium]